MAITLPLELLWADLATSPGAVESSAWHDEILDERRQRVADGSASFLDWEAANMDLRNRLR
jgi:hypothetical protein